MRVLSSLLLLASTPWVQANVNVNVKAPSIGEWARNDVAPPSNDAVAQEQRIPPSEETFLKVDLSGRLHCHLCGPIDGTVEPLLSRKSGPTWSLGLAYDLRNVDATRLLTRLSWKQPNQPWLVRLSGERGILQPQAQALEVSCQYRDKVSLQARAEPNHSSFLSCCLPLTRRLSWQGKLRRLSAVSHRSDDSSHNDHSWIPDVTLDTQGRLHCENRVWLRPPWTTARLGLRCSVRRTLYDVWNDTTEGTLLRVEAKHDDPALTTALRLDAVLERPMETAQLAIVQEARIRGPP